MKYCKAIDIWQLPDYMRKHLHVGQWVTAGRGGTKGRYLGQTKGGTDVVSWANTVEDIKAKRSYALAYGSK
jgi:hypothetical protein